MLVFTQPSQNDALTAKKKTKSQNNSLFIQENSNNDADDKDHGQDRAHHPYEPIPVLYREGVHHQLWGHHCVSVRAGGKHFLEEEKSEWC